MQTRDRITGNNLFVNRLENRFIEYTEDLAEGCISTVEYKNLVDELIETTLSISKGITFSQKTELKEAAKNIMFAATMIGRSK